MAEPARHGQRPARHGGLTSPDRSASRNGRHGHPTLTPAQEPGQAAEQASGRKPTPGLTSENSSYTNRTRTGLPGIGRWIEAKDRERIAGQGKQCRSREGQAMNGLVSRLIYPGASRSVDVGQVERTLQPGEELVWQETTRDERIGLIIRPPAGKQRWIVFFAGTA